MATRRVTIRLKRAYEPPTEGDGLRILVERLWPRGVSKEDAAIDLWLKEIAPSHGAPQVVWPRTVTVGGVPQAISGGN